MNGIVKRRKTANYAQIHNTALQGLEDLRSIGLLAHLLSLPEDWEIRKTHLYNKFGRGPVTNAIKELESKGYWIDVKYRDGKKNFHYYVVSDSPFDDTEAISIIREVINAGHKIMSLTDNYTHLLSIGENQQLKNDTSNNKGIIMDSSSVDFEQLTMNDSPSTVQDRQQQSKYDKGNSNQRNKIQIDNINKESNIDTIDRQSETVLNPSDYVKRLINACNDLYNEYALGRWNKKAWNTLVRAFATETVEQGRHVNIPVRNINAYARQALVNMSYKYDLKKGRVETPQFMDWLY